MRTKFDIKKLKPLHNNPRSISKQNFERLKRDILDDPEFLDKRPLLVNHIDNEYIVYAGNMRLKACLDLGWSEVPVDIDEALELTTMRKRALRDNVEYGETDYDILANEWEDLLLKMDLPELQLPTIENTKEAQEDDFEPPKEAKYKVELGDVFQLGEHRLMCGDSRNFDDIEQLFNGSKADMIFTDPPYLMGFEGNVHADGKKSQNAKFGAIKNDKMSKEEGDEFISDIFEAIKIFVKGSWYVCFYRLGLDYIFRALDNLKMQYKAMVIWNKGNHTLSNSDYMSKYEPIMYGWIEEHNFYGDRSNFDIWDIERTAKNDLHPTMKPIDLCAKAIKNSSKENGIVLDLFGGSGSTLIACEQLNRKCYMMELDPYYCSVIIERWEKLTNQRHKKL